MEVPLERANFSGFSFYQDHGYTIIESLIRNEQVQYNLKSLILDDCATWWDLTTCQGDYNFGILNDFISACKVLQNLSLSHNSLDSHQMVNLVATLRASDSLHSFESVDLKGNKPDEKLTDEVLAFI